MFRRIQHPSTKAEEVVFPADLQKLGQVIKCPTSLFRQAADCGNGRLFINDDDQLRQIAHPDDKFHYFVHKVERVNERRREAVDGMFTLPSMIPARTFTDFVIPPQSAYAASSLNVFSLSLSTSYRSPSIVIQPPTATS